MLGILLQNEMDTLGLALIYEERKVKSVNYLSQEKNLEIIFVDGEREPLATEIDDSFVIAFHKAKHMIIAHFPDNDLAKPPLDEYTVPLSL